MRQQELRKVLAFDSGRSAGDVGFLSSMIASGTRYARSGLIDESFPAFRSSTGQPVKIIGEFL